MTPKDRIIEYYGSQGKAAKAIGVNQQAVDQWRSGYIPVISALKFQQDLAKKMTKREMMQRKLRAKDLVKPEDLETWKKVLR